MDIVWFGGICGDAGDIDITECENYATIILYDGGSHCGGICGISDSSSRSKKIERCNNYGKIIYSKNCIGGIAGKIGSNTDVIDCQNLGDIVSSTNSESISSVGGIVGKSEGNENINIIRCNNKGNIKYENIEQQDVTLGNVGGIVSFYSGNIIDSNNSGNITIKAGAFRTWEMGVVGGILGYSDNATIKRSNNTGTITIIPEISSGSGNIVGKGEVTIE